MIFETDSISEDSSITSNISFSQSLIIFQKNTIRMAYNLYNSRKTKLPDFLFVITDGLFSLSETQKLLKMLISVCLKELMFFELK